MSNKINTTTGNEVKDMNTAELEGKASSSTSQSGGMSNAGKLLVIALGNLVTMGLIVIGYAVLMHGEAKGVAIEAEGIPTEAVLMAITTFIVFPAIILGTLFSKCKKEPETSTEEQSVKVAKTEEVTDAKDEKPSNGLSNAAKFLLIGLGLIVTSALIGFGFALLR